MLFNSYIFWAFFAIVLLLYNRTGHQAQNRLLLVASYIFYGYWDYRFLSLILLSTVIDFFIALAIDATPDSKKKKRLLFLSVAANLSFLGFFKYYNFFSQELLDILVMVYPQASLPVLNIVLPVGISFYTFQTLSYTIDTYYGKLKPTNKFLDYALFVSFFPQLVAGPIERAQRLLPQILEVRKASEYNFSHGFFLVISGLFKKVVIADNMAVIVNVIFSKPATELTGPEIIVGVYAFAFQIYGDFSGYSSIAKGVAKWMGFDLMWNFKNPYFSISPSDFWNRWHISLSSWLRDYLYIPLGGNRFGTFATFRNLLITMFLGGLWHGANWTFILWGLFHGAVLIIYRVVEIIAGNNHFSGDLHPIRRLIYILIMFHIICLSWLFFRAESANQIFEMLYIVATSLQWTSYTSYALLNILFFAIPLLIFEYWTEKTGDLLILCRSNSLVQAVCYSYMTFMLIIFPPLQKQVFIYFQF